MMMTNESKLFSNEKAIRMICNVFLLGYVMKITKFIQYHL